MPEYDTAVLQRLPYGRFWPEAPKLPTVPPSLPELCCADWQRLRWEFLSCWWFSTHTALNGIMTKKSICIYVCVCVALFIYLFIYQHLVYKRSKTCPKAKWMENKNPHTLRDRISEWLVFKPYRLFRQSLARLMTISFSVKWLINRTFLMQRFVDLFHI